MVRTGNGSSFTKENISSTRAFIMPHLQPFEVCQDQAVATELGQPSARHSQHSSGTAGCTSWRSGHDPFIIEGGLD